MSLLLYQVARECSLRPPLKAVLKEACIVADKTGGNVYASMETFGQWTGRSRRCAGEMFEELCEADGPALLRRETDNKGGRGVTARYRVNVERLFSFAQRTTPDAPRLRKLMEKALAGMETAHPVRSILERALSETANPTQETANPTTENREPGSHNSIDSEKKTNARAERAAPPSQEGRAGASASGNEDPHQIPRWVSSKEEKPKTDSEVQLSHRLYKAWEAILPADEWAIFKNYVLLLGNRSGDVVMKALKPPLTVKLCPFGEEMRRAAHAVDPSIVNLSILFGNAA